MSWALPRAETLTSAVVESEIGEPFWVSSAEVVVNLPRSRMNPSASLMSQCVAATMRTLPLVSEPAKL